MPLTTLLRDLEFTRGDQSLHLDRHRSGPFHREARTTDPLGSLFSLARALALSRSLGPALGRVHGASRAPEPPEA